MSLSVKYSEVVGDSPVGCVERFLALNEEPDVQIAIYQKLLYKNGEGDRDAFAVLEELKKHDFPKAMKDAMAIEQQRYNVAKANAIYQDYLYQKVLDKVVTARKRDTREPILQDNLLFDPQGRLVYELRLDEAEQEEVLKKIEAALGKPVADVRDRGQVKAGLNEVLGGRTPTKTTLCSIDLSSAPEQAPAKGADVYKALQEQYRLKYGLLNKIPSEQRGSIVASFEEAYAHMSLMAKTYEGLAIRYNTDAQKNVVISADAWQQIQNNAAQKLQREVAKVYNDAVTKATDKKTKVVDVEKLNKSLAKARTGLAATAKEALMEGVVGHLKAEGLGRNDVLRYVQGLCSKMDKHTATKRTATGYDYFHTSDYLQQGMLISGTQQTAHEKPEFLKDSEDQAAYRRVAYTYRDEHGELNPTSAMSARVPSPALVFHKIPTADDKGKPTLRSMTDKEIKDDLVQKYGFLHDQMRDMRGGKDGPVVEHLFTSFHSAAFEFVGDRNNKQRASALYMMRAMHEFNAQHSLSALQAQVKALKERVPVPHEEEAAWDKEYARLEKAIASAEQHRYNFLYVQNIGTNRHTRDLGYRVDRSFLDVTGSVEMDDITLSTEMAMLHTLQENSAFLSPEIRQDVVALNKKILNNYNHYLDREPREEYFAASDEGLGTIAEIREFKDKLKSQLPTELDEKTEDLPTVASNALARIIATNQHWDSRYGQLAQALSMYIEQASTGGCKSGNERNQDVMLRYSLLKSIDERVQHGGRAKLKPHEEAIYEQLTQYANGNSADPDKLRAAIAVGVSKCNLHGGAASISRDDQGGAAKVSSFSYVQNIKNPLAKGIASFFVGLASLAAGAVGLALTCTAVLAPLGIPLMKKAKNFAVDQLIDTNNAADREMNLDATGASKTQAHKGQDKLTRKAALKVLGKDPLFDEKKGGQPISWWAGEKGLFEKGKVAKLEKEEFKQRLKEQRKHQGAVREEGIRRDEPQHPGEDFGVGSPGVLRDGLRFTHAGSVEEPKKKTVVSPMGNLDSGVDVGVHSDPTSTDPSVVRRVI
ncbi:MULTISPECIES: hypothetical protein [Legionella]|uniref:hypothetical protein n=1 Tax=Legionella TaxID=445 RepID=UPI000964D6CF|nr:MULTISPECIES: hypothetical protein [Legionella]MBN9229009.1 hypothetical protein [Legionella steelei]OJW06411.1 MAG: hypothetical protein BGO44_15715 [Legionella sp. 39-23]